MIRRIAVNTGGGDAPGLNAVIRAVTISAIWRGWEVIGIRYGYRGLLVDGDDGKPAGLIRLDRESVRGITHLGGTILGSANRGDPFHFPVERDGKLVPEDRSDELVRRFRDLKVDALVALGGDGSVNLANQLLPKGMPRVVAVPKTIDNDLLGTDKTFGFDTAVATATEAIDRLHTTAQAHERVMVVEVMGRYAGWIALHSGIAGGADAILLPEVEFDVDLVCEKVLRRQLRGRPFSIVVVAEGATPKGGRRQFKEATGDDAFKEHGQLGGIAEWVAGEIASRTGKETRSIVLGHLQRGGSPVMGDRLLALQLGTAATKFLAEKDGSGMVAIKNGKLEFVPIEEVVTGNKVVDPQNDELVQTGRDLGICFGDETPGTFLPSSAAVPPPVVGEVSIPRLVRESLLVREE